MLRLFSRISGEESGPSNPVTVIPMPPISLPFFDDFETGAPYWIMEDTWGLQNGTYHSSAYALTESPSGDYAANMDASTHPEGTEFHRGNLSPDLFLDHVFHMKADMIICTLKFQPTEPTGTKLTVIPATRIHGF